MVSCLRGVASVYTSADIEKGRADLVLNIESLDLADGTYSCIVCSHILEHVDDRRALAEMRRVCVRVLAIIMTPVVEGWSRTYGNPAITTPLGRQYHFGQPDHVRYYGADVRDRIREAGFELH